MTYVDLPARTDPCWDSPNWRFDKLHECVKAHGLAKLQIAELTGTKPDTARIWLDGRGAVIGANTLHILILQLNSRIA